MKRKNCGKYLAGCLCTLLCLFLLTGCGKSVPEDVSRLCAILTEKGYEADTVDNRYGLLAGIASEMEKALEADSGKKPEGSLAGYVYAKDKKTGILVTEIYIFEKEKDAQLLYDYLEGESRFVEGESEVRRSGKVVYMGYIEALDAIEE